MNVSSTANFRELYDNVLSKITPGDDQLLTHYIYSNTYGLTQKNEHFLVRLFQVIFYGASFDLNDHLFQIEFSALAKTQRIQEYINSTTFFRTDVHSNSSTCAEELLAIAKTQMLCKKLKKHRVQRQCARSRDTAFTKKAQNEIARYSKIMIDASTKCLRTISRLCDLDPIFIACSSKLGAVAINLFNNYHGNLENCGSLFDDYLLKHAAKSKNVSLCFKLIEKGADPRQARSFAGELLQEALVLKKFQLAEKILTVETAISYRDTKGETCLHNAITNNCPIEIIQKMIDQGANLNAVNKDGHTPLHFAGIYQEYFLLLVQNNADLSIQNKYNKTPLHYVLNRIGNNKTHIFHNIFKDFGITHQFTNPNDFLSFIQVNPQELCFHPKNTTEANPLIVPLYLNDTALCIKIASILGYEKYMSYVRQLEDMHPDMEISLLTSPLYTVNVEHLKKGIDTSSDIPNPQEITPLTQILEIFDTINFSNASESNYLCPSSLYKDLRCDHNVDALRFHLHSFVSTVQEETAFTGTPREGSEALGIFYGIIKRALGNILYTIQHEHNPAVRIQKTHTFIVDILKAAPHCGGGYFRTVIKLYNALCLNKRETIEDWFYESLTEYRGYILESTIDRTENHGNNLYNGLLKDHGERLGISGFKLAQKFSDPYARRYSKEYIDQKFFSTYTPQGIQSAWLFPQLKEEEFREKLVDYLKKNIPTSYEAEKTKQLLEIVASMEREKKSRNEIIDFLDTHDIVVPKNTSYQKAIEDDRIYSYTQNVIFSEKLNRVRKSAVALLCHTLGVFRFKDELIHWT